MSVQEVRRLMKNSKLAQQKLLQKSQNEVDKIVENIAKRCEENSQNLAKLAYEETGFGNAEDKTKKNIFASNAVYNAIKNMKTVGVIDRDEGKKLAVYAVPKGVIAGIIPSTNPTSTAIFKALICVKSGNSIVLSPHPSARNCVVETVKIIRHSIAEAGADENLVSCISVPTIQATNELMRHPDTAMILATGGSAMVKAAYSSGNPAIGVGAGNGPAFIDKTADLKQAVAHIIQSKTFDNGTICASEQSVICERCMAEKVQKELENQGGYFLDNSQLEILGKFILRPNGTMNPQIVGKTAEAIARLCGLAIPEGTKVLIARENGIGKGHVYSSEKLCPILAFYVEADRKAVCETCQKILMYEGVGHTFSMHCTDDETVEYFARRIPASRFLVNSASALGGIGATTNLLPSLTLGCGAMGGSSISDNVGPMELLDKKIVAYGVREFGNLDINSVYIDKIVEKVMAKLSYKM